MLGAERDVRVGGRTLRVTIKPGTADGARIRLAGQGGPGEHGGPAGDLLLRVRLRPHPLVRVDGKDLYLDLPLTVPEAVNGAEVELPTFEGKVRFTVAAGDPLREADPAARQGAAGPARRPARRSLRGRQAGAARAERRSSREAVKALEPLYKGDPRAGISL